MTSLSFKFNTILYHSIALEMLYKLVAKRNR